MRVVLGAALAVAAVAIPLFLLLQAFKSHVLGVIRSAAESAPGTAARLFPFGETMIFVAQGFLIILFTVMLVLLLFLLSIVLVCLGLDKPYIGGCTCNP